MFLYGSDLLSTSHRTLNNDLSHTTITDKFIVLFTCTNGKRIFFSSTIHLSSLWLARDVQDSFLGCWKKDRKMQVKKNRWLLVCEQSCEHPEVMEKCKIGHATADLSCVVQPLIQLSDCGNSYSYFVYMLEKSSTNIKRGINPQMWAY